MRVPNLNVNKHYLKNFNRFKFNYFFNKIKLFKVKKKINYNDISLVSTYSSKYNLSTLVNYYNKYRKNPIVMGTLFFLKIFKNPFKKLYFLKNFKNLSSIKKHNRVILLFKEFFKKWNNKFRSFHRKLFKDFSYHFNKKRRIYMVMRRDFNKSLTCKIVRFTYNNEFKNNKFKEKSNLFLNKDIFFFINKFNRNRVLPVNVFFNLNVNINFLNLVIKKPMYLNYIDFNLSFFNNKNKIKSVSQLGDVNFRSTNRFLNNLDLVFLNFVEFYLNRRVYILFKKNFFKVYNSFVINIVNNKFKYIVWRFNKIGDTFFNTRFVVTSFFLKDVDLFKNWFNYCFKNIELWKHRIFIFYVLKIFKFISQKNYANIGIKGFHLEIKGKISVTRDSRKRKVLFKVSKNAKYNLNLKSSHAVKTINTISGVLGLKIWFFY